MTKNDVNIEELLDVKINKINSVLSGNQTYTSLFMIPAYNIYVDETLLNMFINSYIDDLGVKHVFTHPLFLLLKVEDMRNIRFVKIDQYLRENTNFVYTYSVGKAEGKHLVMYVFECPDQFKDDYISFQNSAYSKFSPEYKSKFHKEIPNGQGQMRENPTYSVLHKTSTMKNILENLTGSVLDKDSEYFGEIKKDYEIFRLKN